MSRGVVRSGENDHKREKMTKAFKMRLEYGMGPEFEQRHAEVWPEVEKLIHEYGGFAALLHGIKCIFKGRKAGQLGIGLLVGAMDIATANKTVAIVMANPIAREMAEEYEVSPRKTASLLDTFSCIFQGIIPYGAQMLVAISAAAELGVELSAFDIIPNLFYPYMLLISFIPVSVLNTLSLKLRILAISRASSYAFTRKSDSSSI